MIGNNVNKLEEDLEKKEQFEEALRSALIEDIELSLRDMDLSGLKGIYTISLGSGELSDLERDILKELKLE